MPHPPQDTPQGTQDTPQAPPGPYRPAHRVAVLALEGLIPFEMGIPQRIFGRARDSAGRPLYEVVTCSVGPPGLVRTEADFSILVEKGPETLATADTVIVPASYQLGPVYTEGVLTEELTAPSPICGRRPGWSPSAPAAMCWPPRAF